MDSEISTKAPNAVGNFL